MKIKNFLYLVLIAFLFFVSCNSEKNEEKEKEVKNEAPIWAIGEYNVVGDPDSGFVITKTSFCWNIENVNVNEIEFGKKNESGIIWNVVKSTDSDFVCSYVESDGTLSPHFELVFKNNAYKYRTWDPVTGELSETFIDVVKKSG